MCGIGGIWTRDGGLAEHRELRQMMSAIAHRGPEGAAYGRLDRGRMLVGFLRLGFTDGGTCQQPLHDASGQLSLVYNGEIYDHHALRETLARRGHRFRTRSDSEVILHLYAEHGDAFYEHLNGEFAFALWDARRSELLLVRDRFGVKPLFYAWHRGRLVFASEVKAIHALEGFEASLDPAYWSGPGVGLAECSLTAFRGVRQVRPGHVLRVGRSSVREERWFEPRFGAEGAVDRPRTLDDAARAVRASLERAVARRLEGDPPIALSLSSGIDSTIVGALAARELGARARRLTAFSIGYDDAPYDESATAARTAHSLGLDFERVRQTPTSLAEGFLDATWSIEVPTSSLSTTARLALTRAVRASGHKALLSGEGSDELFGGYPYFGWEALLRARSEGRDVSRAIARFRRVEHASRGVFWDDVREPARLFGHPSAYAARVAQVDRASRWLFARDFRRDVAIASPASSVHTELGALALEGRSPFDATRLVARSVLGSLVIPALGDRVEMAASLEGRAPFLDRDVIALAYTLPEAFCVDVASGVRKLVLRRACADLLPRDHVAPPKHTHMAPCFDDLRASPRGREILETMLAPAAIRRVGVFDPLFVRGLLAAWRVLPRRSSRFVQLDSLVGYVVSVQALHAVHVEDLLGRRKGTLLPLDEDRSPATDSLAAFGGAA